MADSDDKYGELATALARLQGEVETLKGRVRVVEELNASAVNLAVVFGTMFASVPGVEAWGGRAAAAQEAGEGGGGGDVNMS